MRKKDFIIILLILLATPSSAVDMLEDFLLPDEDCSNLFPEKMIMKGFAYACNSEVSGPIEIIIHNNPQNNNFEVSVSSPLSGSNLVFSRNLDVIRTETHFPAAMKKLIQKTGYDIRKYYKNETGLNSNKLILTHYKDGKEKKSARISCDRNTFPSDSVLLMYQALLLKGIKKDFLFDIISLDDALKVRMAVTYHFTDNVLSLSKKFNFPAMIHESIKPADKYHAFEMKLHGLLGLFIQSRWYCIYKASYPYEFAVYWGGSGIGAEVIFILESEIVFSN